MFTIPCLKIYSGLILYRSGILRHVYRNKVKNEICRCRSSSLESTRPSYYITTPIFYVNAVPHIGHLYTAVVADALARWRAICGSSVLFTTGTDEHGLKIQQAAQKSNIPPQVFCDNVSSKFKYLFEKANVGYSDFIRTTEPRHRTAVQQFWQTLQESGTIYRGSYQGWYCTSDEAFLTDDQVTEVTDKHGSKIKVSVDSGNPVEWVKEDNYMFRLSEFSDRLLEWYDTDVIYPKRFESDVRQWVGAGLSDLSVSRLSSRLHWGIPVPGDDSQTIYVWLDALINYLTTGGYPDYQFTWPADCHVIGKDILRFHAVYWPAFLMAAGLPLPKKILCHSHWTMDNLKMSKSLGNVVEPVDRMERYTTDGLRYFLLREGVPHSDGNYSDKRVLECINSELVNTLGNLLNRTTGAAINPRQVVPGFQTECFHQHGSTEEHRMLQHLQALPGLVDSHYGDFNIYKGIDAIISQLHQTNAFIQTHKPWELSKQPAQQEWLDCILALALETLRVTGILLQPVVPTLSDQLLSRLNIDQGMRLFQHTQGKMDSHERPLGPNTGVLMKRLKA